jgi:hypothetical protein
MGRQRSGPREVARRAIEKAKEGSSRTKRTRATRQKGAKAKGVRGDSYTGRGEAVCREAK